MIYNLRRNVRSKSANRSTIHKNKFAKTVRHLPKIPKNKIEREKGRRTKNKSNTLANRSTIHKNRSAKTVRHLPKIQKNKIEREKGRRTKNESNTLDLNHESPPFSPPPLPENSTKLHRWPMTAPLLTPPTMPLTTRRHQQSTPRAPPMCTCDDKLESSNNVEREIKKQDEKNCTCVVTFMDDKLESSNNGSLGNECCIYKIPEFILKGREHFYRPVVMSIGPVHNCYDTKLQLMQDVKWIYLKCFLRKTNNSDDNPSVCPYIKFVKDNEMKIRGCYQEKISLSIDELAKIIVLDAAFLIYSIMADDDRTENPFKLPIIENKLQPALCYSELDIFRLENQIPYFVLKGIYDIAFGVRIPGSNTFINATLTFIGKMGVGIPGSKAVESIIKIIYEEKILHLLDLQRICFYVSRSKPLSDKPNTINQTTNQPAADSSSSSTNQPANSSSSTNQPADSSSTSVSSYISKTLSSIWPTSLCKWLLHNDKKTDDRPQIHTAKQLKDAGVTFVAGDTENFLDITFDCGKLTISCLNIEDSTEANLRNLVYFEQCHHSGDSYFIDYVFFLDNLIDTAEDVQVLIKYKIFINDLGSNREVVNLFNNICKNVFFDKDNSKYNKVVSNLNLYASKRRNQWMAILRSKYFNHPWVILSVIAAFAIFVLTLLQTTAAFIYK